MKLALNTVVPWAESFLRTSMMVSATIFKRGREGAVLPSVFQCTM